MGLYGLLCTKLNKLPGEVAQLTWPELNRLGKFWSRSGEPSEKPFKASTPEEWAQFASAIGAPVVKRGG